MTESRLTVVLDPEWALVGSGLGPKICFWVVHVLHPGAEEEQRQQLVRQRHFDKLLKTKTRVSAGVSKQQHARLLNLTLDMSKPADTHLVCWTTWTETLQLLLPFHEYSKRLSSALW